VEFIYGIQGSDARVSVWTPLAPTEEEQQPTPLQFNAWTRHGDSIYIHGGYNFMEKDFSKRKPYLDEVWELNLESRQWKKLSTTGTSPGPRYGHVMFAHKDAIYVWGGVGSSGFGYADTKLYCLDLGTCRWQALKTRGSLSPSQREDHAGVIYQGKFYIFGGKNREGGVSDELWCLNMDNLKWTILKRGKRRYCHKMWAARGKLYVLGGRDQDKAGGRTREWTIDDFDVFDIEGKTWFENLFVAINLMITVNTVYALSMEKVARMSLPQSLSGEAIHRLILETGLLRRLVWRLGTVTNTQIFLSPTASVYFATTFNTMRGHFSSRLLRSFLRPCRMPQKLNVRTARLSC